jgi:RHS repeat-associated protein
MQVDGTSTSYLVDPFNGVNGVSQVLSEESAGQSTQYLYGLDLLGHLGDNGASYYAYDALSVRVHFNNAGEIGADHRYGPFGEVLGVGPSGYGFSGERYDAEVGLVYLRARYYQPATGRFLSRDSWPGDYAEPGSLHRFGYVGANPVNRVDPTGHVAPGGATPSEPYIFDEGWKLEEHRWRYYIIDNPSINWQEITSWGYDDSVNAMFLDLYQAAAYHGMESASWRVLDYVRRQRPSIAKVPFTQGFEVEVLGIEVQVPEIPWAGFNVPIPGSYAALGSDP